MEADLDSLDHVHAFANVAKDDMLAVQVAAAMQQ